MHIVDAQTFWSRLTTSETKPMHASAPTTKAPKETITLPVGNDISLSDEHLLSGLLEDLLATPEMPRRFSKSISSRVPSLGQSSGAMIPFEPHGTPGLPWDSSADFGLDFGDFGEDGGNVEMTVDDFKHSLGGIGEMVVPNTVDVRAEIASKRQKRAKRPRISKYLVVDDETVLGREELLLENEDGLLPQTTKWDPDLKLWLSQNQTSEVESKRRPSNPKDIEQVRGIESGVFDGYDPYYHQDEMVTMEGHRVTSSSIAMGDGSPLALKAMSGLSAASLLGSSPVPKLGDWNVPDQVALRRDSLDFYCHLQEMVKGENIMDFNVILRGQRKRAEVAKTFYHILNLASSGAIKVQQNVHQGPIAIQVLA